MSDGEGEGVPCAWCAHRHSSRAVTQSLLPLVCALHLLHSYLTHSHSLAHTLTQHPSNMDLLPDDKGTDTQGGKYSSNTDLWAHELGKNVPHGSSGGSEGREEDKEVTWYPKAGMPDALLFSSSISFINRITYVHSLVLMMNLS